MNRKQIILNLLILVVFTIGLALIPFTALGYYEKLDWELFASTYVIDPQVTSNYYTGDIGSEFEVTGKGYPPFSRIYLGVNDDDYWSAITSADYQGNFFKVLSTYYFSEDDYDFIGLTFSTGDVYTSIPLFIMPSAPVRTSDDTSHRAYIPRNPKPILNVFLPLISR